MKDRINHPNKDRKFYVGEICNISPTYKAHRLKVPKDIQELADNLHRLIEKFKLNYERVQALFIQEYGEGVGLQQFFYHFLSREHGVGFIPRKKTLGKYKYLEKTLMDAEKYFDELNKSKDKGTRIRTRETKEIKENNP